MVGTRKSHTRSTTPFYLVCILTIGAALSACSPQTDRTVVQLHFKTGEQVDDLLNHLLGDEIQYQVIDNSVVFNAPQEQIEPALSVIKNLDQPPVSYEMVLKSKNIKSYSTKREPNALFLVEGKTTTTQFNGHTIRVTINKANNRQSLIHVLSQNKKGRINENHWLLPHNQSSNPDPKIFPKGFTLKIQ